MTMFKGPLAATVAACAAIMAAPASAEVFVYSIDGGLFTDGTAFTGGFSYDSVTNRISDYNVSTSNGAISGYDYSAANSGAYIGGGAGPNNFIFMNTLGSRYFNLSFANPLSSGVTQAISLSSSYECLNCSPFRRVAAGSLAVGAAAVSAVPEPATWGMMILGMGVVGSAMRRRQKVSMRVSYAV